MGGMKELKLLKSGKIGTQGSRGNVAKLYIYIYIYGNKGLFITIGLIHGVFGLFVFVYPSSAKLISVILQPFFH
jgi:hypothetical protein